MHFQTRNTYHNCYYTFNHPFYPPQFITMLLILDLNEKCMNRYEPKMMLSFFDRSKCFSEEQYVYFHVLILESTWDSLGT